MVVGLLLAACGPAVSQRPTADATQTAGVESPSPSASATRAPTATPFPTLPPTSTPTSLADSTWWRGSIEVGIGNETVTGRLSIGERRGEGLGPAFARGPFRGRVVAASARSGLTDLTIMDVPTGSSLVVVSEPDIMDATLDPTGETLFWVTGGSGEDAVWRMSLLDGSSERLFDFPAPAASAADNVLVAYLELTAQVEISADGQRLAAIRCSQDGCRLGAMDLPDGEVAWYEAGPLGTSMLGFAERGISLVSVCLTIPDGSLVEDCGALDARAASALVARNLTGNAELPSGWHLETRPVPNSAPMSFQAEVVAVPDGGGDAVPFVALTVIGQG
jgi:hypothetical protein